LTSCLLYEGSELDKIICMMKMVDYFDKDYLEANPNFYDYIYQLAYNFAGAESQDLRISSIILLLKF